MNLHAADAWPALLEAHLRHAKRPLIVVLGPTASGKTAFSIQIAKAIGAGAGFFSAAGGTPAPAPFTMAEIINADSRQLYRHLDVGTAKVTEQEKDGVSHHLFGVLDPSVDVTVSRYKKMAETCIDEVLARKSVPILVGGSMLYISAIIDGLEPLEPVEPLLRKRLEAAYDEDKGRTLYEKLQEIDPETAASFHPNNRPYLVRAMAIYEATGKPPSSLKKTFECPYDLLLLGMYWERQPLTKRIQARTPLLLKNGWVEEVLRLREMGYGKDTPAMKSHGYREVLETIQRIQKNQTIQRKENLIDAVQSDPALIDIINLKTRQYAKRQMTWWKHDERIQWINCK
jgi:tRNA dimethylallyltransferase